LENVSLGQCGLGFAAAEYILEKISRRAAAKFLIDEIDKGNNDYAISWVMKRQCDLFVVKELKGDLKNQFDEEDNEPVKI
jgi:hypothetical protein